MASRRFFYDPYDYYYSSPYHYPYPYYQYQHPAPSRGVGWFFPAAADAAPEAVKVDSRPRVESSRSVSIPVRFVGSNTEPVRGAARMPPAAAAVPRKRAPSAEAAAVRLQAAARGFMARRSVRAVRDVEREAAEVAEKVAREAEALRGDARARLAVGEALMRMLLRLDAVRGSREFRRNGEPEAEEPEQGAGEEKEAVPGDANVDVDEPEDSDAEGEWEMVTENEDTTPGAATSGDKEAPRKEPACPLETMSTVSTGTASDGVDARKVMEMVAALCEQSAQQCAVIGALAERVDALERTVRRMEDAESRRRRAKKLSTESK